jgi:predicted transglutaminase-like cysteine proteinase
MRRAVHSLMAAVAIVAVSVQYGADAALTTGPQIQPAPVDPLRLSLLSPYLSGPEMSAQFDPHATLFAAIPPVPEAAPKAVPPDSLSDVKAGEAGAATAPEQSRPQNMTVSHESGEVGPVRPSVEALPETLTPKPAAEVKRQTVPESQLRASVPDYETPAAKIEPAPLAKPREPETAKGAPAGNGRVSYRMPSARVGKPSARRIARIEFDTPALAPMAHASFCLKYPDDCKVQKVVFRGGALELSDERRAELTRVNAEVNRTIRPEHMNESVANEKWLIAPAVGDCNDYAVTKRHELLARGWPARALLLAEVVVPWGEHHLVLVIRTRDGDLVADNLNKGIRAWNRTAYRWERVQSPANPTFWSTVKAPEPDIVAMAGQGPRL